MTLRYTPTNIPDDVEWAFTRAGLEELVHHAHWIPVHKGITDRFLRRHWPGLTLGTAMQQSKAAGVWMKSREGYPPLRVRAKVKEFHILFDGSTRTVE